MMTDNISTPTHIGHIHRKSLEINVTPVGDQDKKPKIQLCLEMRKKEILKKSKNSKKTEQNVLEVTVMWVKYLPNQSRGRRPNPFVKLRLLPEDDIQITELQLEKSDAQYIEVFTFPLNKTSDLNESILEIQVCDNKATRNAKQFGNVSIPLNNLKLGQPKCEWYHLVKSESDNDKVKKKAEKTEKQPSKSKKIPNTITAMPMPIKRGRQNRVPVKEKESEKDDDKQQQMKENTENLKSLKLTKSKSKRKMVVLSNDTSIENEIK